MAFQAPEGFSVGLAGSLAARGRVERRCVAAASRGSPRGDFWPLFAEAPDTSSPSVALGGSVTSSGLRPRASMKAIATRRDGTDDQTEWLCRQFDRGRMVTPKVKDVLCQPAIELATSGCRLAVKRCALGPAGRPVGDCCAGHPLGGGEVGPGARRSGDRDRDVLLRAGVTCRVIRGAGRPAAPGDPRAVGDRPGTLATLQRPPPRRRRARRREVLDGIRVTDDDNHDDGMTDERVAA